MIGFLKGKIFMAAGNVVLLDVGGVGFEVTVPVSLINNLPGKGSEVVFFTHFVLREDGAQLFGFSRQVELELFRKIINVNGVGPKAAMTLLSVLSPDELRQAVLREDILALTRAPGIGKKTAGRIILELKDQLAGTAAGVEAAGNAVESLSMNDAEEALVNLGYGRADARFALNLVAKGSPGGLGSDTAALIKEALKFLGKGALKG